MPKFDDEENKKLNKGITNLVKERKVLQEKCLGLIKKVL